MKKIITKKLLENLYWNKKLTQKEIANKLNTRQNRISFLMKKFNIPRKEKIKYCCIDCGKDIYCNKHYKRCHSCENKRRYKFGILNNKKENNGSWKGGKPKCVDCGKQLSAYKHKRCKLHRNKFYSMKGRNNPRFGKSPAWKIINYNNFNFRSSWEANFAKWCDLSGIKW